MKLDGTELRGEGSIASMLDVLTKLRRRGERHARREQIGCAFVVLGVIGGCVLLYFGRIWIFGVEALIVLMVYHYATSLDPELAEDERLAFAIDWLTALSDKLGPDTSVKMWAELNAYDMAVADEQTPAEHGRMKSRWQQPWFRFDWSDGEAKHHIEIELEAHQLQDGIRVLEERLEQTIRYGEQVRTEDRVPNGRELADWCLSS